MMDEQNSIELNNVSKSFKIHHKKRATVYEHLFTKATSYETLNVLDNVSFQVKKGEMLGIIGRNGEGKTTLLRIIGKVFKPNSGSVEVNGSIVPFLELGAGFQPELNAVDNISLYGTYLGFSKKEIEAKIPTILEYAELEKFAYTRLRDFSSGMYARLAFSTAIQVDPDILLIDEVLSVGDVAFQKKSFGTFLSFKKRGKTIIFVSHNLEMVERLCDRVLYLREGKIRKLGDPAEVINTYLDQARADIVAKGTIIQTNLGMSNTAGVGNSSSHEDITDISTNIISPAINYENEYFRYLGYKYFGQFQTREAQHFFLVKSSLPDEYMIFEHFAEASGALFSFDAKPLIDTRTWVVGKTYLHTTFHHTLPNGSYRFFIGLVKADKSKERLQIPGTIDNRIPLGEIKV